MSTGDGVNVDRCIEMLKMCDLPSESEVKQLCDKAKEILVSSWVFVHNLFQSATVGVKLLFSKWYYGQQRHFQQISDSEQNRFGIN